MQTHRPPKHRYAQRRAGCRWTISRERWRQIIAGRDAERLAAPEPVQRAAHRAGDWRGYAMWVIDGVTTRVELHQAPGRGNARPRCDSLEGRADGVVVASGGLNAINRHAAQWLVPRSMSRRTVAGLQTMWTERDEADAAAV